MADAAGPQARRQLGGALDQQAGEQVGDDDVERTRRRGRGRARECERAVDAVDRGVLARHRAGVGIGVDAPHLAGAELRGGDGEDARAGADVEHRAPAPPRSARSSRTRQPRVLAWWPVPNAMPGSSTMPTRPAGTPSTHGGWTNSRSPIANGGKWAFQFSAQPSSVDGVDRDPRRAQRRERVAQRGDEGVELGERRRAGEMRDDAHAAADVFGLEPRRAVIEQKALQRLGQLARRP